ncbi:MAG: IgGFc-binding protein [Deltaproteobacteria bacterium]|nr:IgGFc-binding protein [Deltaproteobacteria bacterium]
MRSPIGLLVLLSACGAPGGDPSATAPGDGSGDVAAARDVAGTDAVRPGADATLQEAGPCPEGPGVVCCPGDTNGCSPDARQIYTCTADGTGWEGVDCLDAGGEPTLCLESVAHPLGFCTACVPGERRCEDDDTVFRCGEEGLGWAFHQGCDGELTGKICLEGACISQCEVNAKQPVYIGCEFWAVDLDNSFLPWRDLDAQGAQFSVVVSNPSHRYPATITVEGVEGPVTGDSSGLPFPTEPLPPGGLRIYNMPRRDVDGTVLAPLAYRLRASVPITAYQFNPLENVDVFSNDASLLLPDHVAGKYYFVMTREETWEYLRSYLTVVAIRPGDTHVTVDVTAPTLVGSTAAGDPIPHLEPGDTWSGTLRQFDVLNLETDAVGADMTGSMVLADRPVVVFGGSEASNVPNTNHCLLPQGVCEWDGMTACAEHQDCNDAGFVTCCADHLEQQMFPVKSWGTRYVAARSYPRNQELDSYRIMAAEDNTLVTTLPVQVNIPVLHRGEWVDFESGQDFEIQASRPVLVGQYLACKEAPGPNLQGELEPGDAGIGDPAFILLVPVEQFRTDYVFLAPDKYALDYVTLVAPTAAEVWFDCPEPDPARIPSSCAPVPEEDWSWLMSGEYKATRFPVPDGVHRVHGSAGVGVYAYGYDERVSYGYPAGMDIADLGLVKEPGED